MRCKMTEKRLSETMSDATYAVSQAQETLNNAITKAINTHFEAGIQVEQERIIKLLEEDDYMIESDRNHAISLIKGEQK